MVGGDRFNRNLREKIFTLKMVGIWKELPQKVVEADTIIIFKINLDRYVERFIGAWAKSGQVGLAY